MEILTLFLGNFYIRLMFILMVALLIYYMIAYYSAVLFSNSIDGQELNRQHLFVFLVCPFIGQISVLAILILKEMKEYNAKIDKKQMNDLEMIKLMTELVRELKATNRLKNK